MHTTEVDDYARFQLQMQLALSRLAESEPPPVTVATETAALQLASPAARLKELAELDDLGIVNEGESRMMKAELLSTEWSASAFLPSSPR